MFHKSMTPDFFNKFSEGTFPGLVGVRITRVEEGCLTAEMPIKAALFAPNEFLHAGSIITFADTVAGYSVIAHLPEKAKSFTTIELKSNFMGAAREGVLECESSIEHIGRTTHVWRVEVRHQASQKKIAIFSCTQLILYK